MDLLIYPFIVLQEAHVYATENGLFVMKTSAKSAANANKMLYEIGDILKKQSIMIW